MSSYQTRLIMMISQPNYIEVLLLQQLLLTLLFLLSLQFMLLLQPCFLPMFTKSLCFIASIPTSKQLEPHLFIRWHICIKVEINRGLKTWLSASQLILSQPPKLPRTLRRFWFPPLPEGLCMVCWLGGEDIPIWEISPSHSKNMLVVV